MIIVTLSVVCTLKGMSRWSIQRIKAMLLCIEYGILFVYTVDTKIKACKALNAIYVDTVNTRQGSLMHSMLSMSTLLIQNTSTHSCPQLSQYSMDFQSAKSFEKLRLRAFQPYHLYYICRHCRYKTRISNAFNAIYVHTVDTVFTPHSTLYKVSCKSHKHQCQQCRQT